MAFECYGLIAPWKIVTVADQQLGGCPAPSVVSGCSWAPGIVVTGGGSLSLQSVGGSISGLTITDSTFSMDAASTASLGGTIQFENAGAVELTGTSIVAGSTPMPNPPTCCDGDGSCTDGDDDYCCGGEFFCSHDGAEYAASRGGILCPQPLGNCLGPAGPSLAVVGAGTAVSLDSCTVDAAVRAAMQCSTLFEKLLRFPFFFAAASGTAHACLPLLRAACRAMPGRAPFASSSGLDLRR